MRIATSAPGRCGIVGNPSDIYGGCVVSCSTPVRARCMLVFGEGERLPEDLRLWKAATGRFPVEPCRVEWATDIPRSSGLSGSTALLGATLACVLKARGERPDIETDDGKVAFAELLRDVELRDAGVVCGYQDAYMIVYGGLNRLDFDGKHPVESGPPGRVTPIQAPLPFLLVTTGVERLSGSVHGPMRDRWLRGERLVVEAMDRIAELGRLGADAIRRGDWRSLAELMTENHRLVAELGGSCDEIDRLMDRCVSNGALAAKLAGAGLGGTVIALAPDPDGLRSRLLAEEYSRFLRPQIQPGLRFERPPPTG